MVPDRLDVNVGESGELREYFTRIRLGVLKRYRQFGACLLTVRLDPVRVIPRGRVDACPFAFIEEGHAGLAVPTGVPSGHRYIGEGEIGRPELLESGIVETFFSIASTR
jgi:hypothetical protein